MLKCPSDTPAGILLLRTFLAIKSWLSIFIKNFIFIAIVYKISDWIFEWSYELLDASKKLALWVWSFGNVPMLIFSAISIITIYLLGKYPLTQIWVFSFQQAAEKNSYFAIRIKNQSGGYYYGVVHNSYIEDGERLYDAITFFGGWSPVFRMKSGEFERLEMSIPEVIFCAYIAPWFPTSLWSDFMSFLKNLASYLKQQILSLFNLKR